MTENLYEKLTKLAGLPVQRIQVSSDEINPEDVIDAYYRTSFSDWVNRSEIIDKYEEMGFQTPGSFHHSRNNQIQDIIYKLGGERVNSDGRYLTRLRREIYKAGFMPAGEELRYWESFIQRIQTRAFVANDIDEYLDITLHADWEDGQFGKDGSCWWGCYYQSRPTLILNGGGAIRFFNTPRRPDSGFTDWDGYGRMWFAPFEPEDFHLADSVGFVVFNQYGIGLRNAGLKLLFSKLLGEPVIVTEIGFQPNTREYDVPYVNGHSGYAITKLPIPVGYQYAPDWDYSDDVDEYTMIHSCYNCGDRLRQDEEIYDDQTDEFYCSDCFDRLFTQCPHCGGYHRIP